MYFQAINTSDPCADIEEIIAANALSNLLAAQLEQARRLKKQSGRRGMIQEIYNIRGYSQESRIWELVKDEARAFLGWAKEFDHTRHMMQLLGLSDDAIDEYQRQVREAAESVLGG